MRYKTLEDIFRCYRGKALSQQPIMATGPGCKNFRFSIDRGGTFTDVFAEYEDEKGQQHEKVLKLLSVDPANYPDAPREGIRRVLETCTGLNHPRNSPLDTTRIASIRMGTTVRARPFQQAGMWTCTRH